MGVVDVYKEKMLSRQNWAGEHMNSQPLWQHLSGFCKLNPEKKNLSMKGTGGYNVPPLAEELLAFDSYSERDTQFSLMVWSAEG